jgi:excisionase family DNA binding protein
MTITSPGRSNKSPKAPTGLPSLLTIAQVADATGVSTKTVRRWCSSGLVRWHKLGARVIRIERDSVLALLGAA